MGVAGDHLRKGADMGAAQRVLRQQRRLGVDFIQPFDDGKRLGQDRAAVLLQRRHQPLRVDHQIAWVALLAPAQMMGQVFGT
ncbi:hypothetical protein GALL_498970 [mine drainage metagenome]|uniref:Uncharacterized protein n=1 Tax=mine drainage metagenome TaxID=410659 RepID=A0A1J5PB36_9ZZZZ